MNIEVFEDPQFANMDLTGVSYYPELKPLESHEWITPHKPRTPFGEPYLAKVEHDTPVYDHILVWVKPVAGGFWEATCPNFGVTL